MISTINRMGTYIKLWILLNISVSICLVYVLITVDADSIFSMLVVLSALSSIYIAKQSASNALRYNGGADEFGRKWILSNEKSTGCFVYILDVPVEDRHLMKYVDRLLVSYIRLH